MYICYSFQVQTDESEEVAVELPAKNTDIQLPVQVHVRIDSTSSHTNYR